MSRIAALVFVLLLLPALATTAKPVIASGATTAARAAVLAQPHSAHVTCKEGYLQGLPRKHFWKYGHDGHHAMGLVELIASEHRVYAVFNLKTSNRAIPWQDAKWEFRFKAPGLSKPSLGSSFGKDPHNHTFIVYTPLPSSLGATEPEQPMQVTITARLPRLTYKYEYVPLCLHPDQLISRANEPAAARGLAKMFAPTLKVAAPEPTSVQGHNYLTACTSITSDSLEAVPEWVAYHRLQGFEHFYIYINSPPQTAQVFLRPLVEEGLVTLIDWNFPEHYANTFLYQMAQQNSCLLRARGRSTWVALHDVDEYFQPMLKDPSKTVATFLKSRRSHLASMGAYKVQSWFFGSSEGAPVLDFHMCQLRLATYLYRAAGPVTDRRQKLLARPENVQYVSVHRITRGKPERVPNPHTDLRLVHYKLADERQYPVRDDSSMSHFAAAVQATMAPWCGH